MLKVAGLAFLLVGASIDMPAVDGIEITQSIESYPVTGSNARQMLAQMQALGPLDSIGGRRNFGHTATDLQWSYGLASDGEARCRIDDMSIAL